jgi:hypothetical protein
MHISHATLNFTASIAPGDFTTSAKAGAIFHVHTQPQHAAPITNPKCLAALTAVCLALSCVPFDKFAHVRLYAIACTSS